MLLGKLNSHMQKNEIGPLHHSQNLILNVLKIYVLYVRPKTINLINENVGQSFMTLVFAK